MKKKNMIGGFTLIECLVALAILGISSMLLAQAYSQLMTLTNRNNTISYSISQQMADAEKPGGSSEGVSALASTGTREFTITPSNLYTSDPAMARDYTYDVTVYRVMPYKNTTHSSSGTTTTDDTPGTDVRYVYFHK